MEVLSFFVGNNNPKKGLSPLIFRFLFRYLLQISEKGVPCANAMAEIIPNEPDTDHAGGGIFLSVYFCFFSIKASVWMLLFLLFMIWFNTKGAYVSSTIHYSFYRYHWLC